MPEFLRDAQWFLWIAGALVLGLLELTSLDLVFGMLVLGALAAGGVALAGFGFVAQALVFTVVSGLGLVVARPYIKRAVDRSVPDAPTNVDALTGRTALALTDVDDRGGQVKLSGETWSARTVDRGERVPAGSDVVVVRIDGATALVRADADRPAPTDLTAPTDR
ncbi:NfeD family protein [Aquipuribacter hungaricus]|uniref:NfeD family protein n=1 Tax=Aquipuribacter hungaricus TaxID=545624 RepID=A0ABV7WCQ4_9MICO